MKKQVKKSGPPQPATVASATAGRTLESMPEVIEAATGTGRSIGIDYRLRRRRVSSSRMGTGLGWFIRNRKIAAIIKKNITVSIFALSFLRDRFLEMNEKQHVTRIHSDATDRADEKHFQSKAPMQSVIIIHVHGPLSTVL